MLENGSILEQETHEELSETGGLYARIYQAQRITQQSTVWGENVS